MPKHCEKHRTRPDGHAVVQAPVVMLAPSAGQGNMPVETPEVASGVDAGPVAPAALQSLQKRLAALEEQAKRHSQGLAAIEAELRSLVNTGGSGRKGAKKAKKAKQEKPASAKD